MNASLRHRGPDDGGLEDLADAILGMRRLSIIDVAGGHQPIFNETGDIAVVCNGEIYNYIELRQQLTSRGHGFRTRSDAETLVHLYEDRALDLLAEVDGMFAFAIWDSQRKRLLLGRDRTGEKPLHYTLSDNLFLFGSELKALLAHPSVHRIPDWSSLRLYLLHNYVPSPRTAWQGISELPAGHLCVVEEGTVSIRAYWSWPEAIPCGEHDRARCLAELDVLLHESVKIRLRSDVPVGLFISGGVDSSLVAALAREMSDQDEMPSFGLTFPGSRWDESAYQREVARTIGTVHNEVPMSADGLLEKYATVLRQLDEPFGDTSMLSTYALAEYASQHVKVVLTGDGGDEMFAGYDHYIAITGQHAAGRFPIAWDVWSRSGLDTLLTGPLAGPVQPDPLDELFEQVRGETPLNQALAFDRRSLLNDNNLVKPDRAGMAHGLEARCPLLSHHLAEWASAMSPEVLLDGGRPKSLLKDLAGRHYRAGFFDRPKGMFTVPLGDWLRTSLRSEGEAILSALIDRGLVKAEPAQRLSREHLGGTANHTRQLRALVVLELWFRACVDGHS